MVDYAEFGSRMGEVRNFMNWNCAMGRAFSFRKGKNINRQ